MNTLKNKRVAILATDGVEESELTSPKEALEKAGATVDVISLENNDIQSVHHMEKSKKIKVSKRLSDIRAKEYDALQLPGGAVNADTLRANVDALNFVGEMSEMGKPIAAICHAPWILVSADLVKGRKLTSYHTIQDDIKNAGGEWEDKEVVQDGNWVTSRSPEDLPAFNEAMIELFAQKEEKKKEAA